MMLIDDYNNLPKPNSEYEEKVITFCKLWLNGQESFILKTSGSTGEPKPISLSRKQMEASALLTGKTFGLKEQDLALVCLNVEYIAGIMMLVRGMVLKLKLLILPPSSNPLLNIENQKIDFAAFVPLQLQSILESDNKHLLITLNRMKAIIVGGAAVSQQLVEQTQELSVPAYSTYGMTETVSHIAIRRINGENTSQNFKVLSGVKIGIDERNCLNILSAASNFELVQTNDLVEIIAKDEFKLLGRFDNIINSGGVKIQLEKVENTVEVFLESLHINRFFAFGMADERLGQKLILVLESENLDDEIKRKLLEDIKNVSDTIYQIPKNIFTISTFSETPTGKIDKKATIKRLNL
ncbi:AMP-binding protein [Arcicella rosea]|uniref:O-succinylbenzoic acid--CoA ligase n=1 Tax=Arcicella rosea TaxID=502909 RepID=A0A841ELR0_9BACT|nr:AMP-binding protein [Arcicella rosea]MBB6005087.1 O-succinylbenzoic acid--CoA ligase [Arcicella rosea]